MSTVYLFKCDINTPISKIKAGVDILCSKIKAKKLIKRNDLTAIKVHFGEEKNITFVPVSWIKTVVDTTKNYGAKPFLTDTNVLYKSKRINAVEHLQLAYQNGFTFENTGAPIIIADGLIGNNETIIEISCDLNKQAAIANEIINADSVILCTHPTGHVATSFAATLKNMGMGMSARKSKLIQHSSSKVHVGKSCINCGQCIKNCPVNAISIEDGKAFINDSCISCGECMTICKKDAIKFKWDSGKKRLGYQIVEHALAAYKGNPNMVFLSFAVNFTSYCDCVNERQTVVSPDIGILASLDPVSLDAATLDLLTTNDIDKDLAKDQLDYANKIGLGDTNYQLEVVSLN